MKKVSSLNYGWTIGNYVPKGKRHLVWTMYGWKYNCTLVFYGCITPHQGPNRFTNRFTKTGVWKKQILTGYVWKDWSCKGCLTFSDVPKKRKDRRIRATQISLTLILIILHILENIFLETEKNTHVKKITEVIKKNVVQSFIYLQNILLEIRWKPHVKKDFEQVKQVKWQDYKKLEKVIKSYLKLANYLSNSA